MKTDTWNTWDVRCLNAVMKLPELCELRVSLYDDYRKRLQENMLWRDVSQETLETAVMNDNLLRLGHHDLEGRYFDIDLKYLDFSFNFRFASNGDSFVAALTPLTRQEGIKFFINALFRWNAHGSVEKRDEMLVLRSAGNEWQIDCVGTVDRHTKINTDSQGLLLESIDSVYIRCNSSASPDKMNELLDQAEMACLNRQLRGTGILADVPEAIIKGVVWNTIYEPIKNRICTPVARTWCTANGHSFGSYVLFEWDTFFVGILSAMQDKELARFQIESILQEITPGGFVPNLGSQRYSSVDRSQPPVGAYCVLKLYSQFLDPELLRSSYEKLLVWNRWWMPHRDGNGDGLLEWGSDPDPLNPSTPGRCDLQAAMYESGLDNSPMYDGVVFNENNHTMELADVGLNALYALDCWALATIAEILGKTDESRVLVAEYERVKKLINERMWDEDAGIYKNLSWNGDLSPRLSPCNFYPMLAGIPDPARAKRMVDDHLMNPKEFWGEFVIPSISRNDPAFPDNDYWRGRIWGPMNFLVAEGLKRNGFYDCAYEFASRSLNLFMGEWRAENHIHENYNAVSGDGDDRKNADALYTWGALLGQISVGELVEAQAWGGWRFGNLSEDHAGIQQFPLGASLCTVQTGPAGLSVHLDDRLFLKSDVAILVKDCSFKGTVLSLDVLCRKPGSLEVHLWEGLETADIMLHGQKLPAQDLGSRCLGVTW